MLSRIEEVPRQVFHRVDLTRLNLIDRPAKRDAEGEEELQVVVELRKLPRKTAQALERGAFHLQRIKDVSAPQIFHDAQRVVRVLLRIRGQHESRRPFVGTLHALDLEVGRLFLSEQGIQLVGHGVPIRRAGTTVRTYPRSSIFGLV